LSAFLNSTHGTIFLGAAIALIGVLVGWIISAPLKRNASRAQTKAKHDAAARDLAMRTVLALDDFVGGCYAAAHDEPEFNPADPGDFILHTDDPTLVLPRDANWALLKPDMIDEVIWLPNRLRNAVEALESLDISSPDFGDYFEHRAEEFSRLGLRALDLMEALSAAYSVPRPERPAFYRPRDGMQAKVTEMTALWSRRHKVQRAIANETSNVTPLFVGSGVPKSMVAPEGEPKA
jgi:hypothetical protein